MSKARKAGYSSGKEHKPVEFSQEESSLAQDAAKVWGEIERLDLVRNIAELEVLGYTVIPPARAARAGFASDVLNKILDVYERRNGKRLEINASEPQSDQISSLGVHVAYLLFEDPIFQEAVLNENVLALTDYTLGKNAVLYDCVSLIKGPDGPDLAIHCDNVMISSPFPPHEMVVNFTWALTDYSEADGSTFFIPGSHKQYRHPKPNESREDAVHITAPAGSLILWSGRVWHGSKARKNPGLRVNLITSMCRPYIRPQEPYREDVEQELLDKHPERFATLLGQHINYGWREEGPQGEAGTMGRHIYD